MLEKFFNLKVTNLLFKTFVVSALKSLYPDIIIISSVQGHQLRDSKELRKKIFKEIKISKNRKVIFILGESSSNDIISFITFFKTILKSKNELEIVFPFKDEIDIKSILDNLSTENGINLKSLKLSVKGDFLNFINCLNLNKEAMLNQKCFYELFLTKNNCYYADDVLMTFRKERFQNWVFIGDSILEGDQIDDEIAFHSVMFFDKLLKEKDIAIEKKFYYREIISQISANKRRNSFLPFGKYFLFNGQILTPVCRNELIEKNINHLVYENRLKLSYIAKRSMNAVKGVILKKRLDYCLNKKSKKVDIKSAKLPHPRQWKKIMITGWYGTETTGDKAILAEIVHFFKEKNYVSEFLITTLDKKVSLKTNKEIPGLEKARIVDLAEAYKSNYIEEVDAVIFGGGPIMQSNALFLIRDLFVEANRQEKARVIFGCGMGPFHSKEMVEVAHDILRLSTSGFFRDEESLEIANRLIPNNNFDFCCDPSIGYLSRVKKERLSNFKADKEMILSTLFRAQTTEFKLSASLEDIEKENYDKSIKFSKMIDLVIQNIPLRIRLYAMNYHWLGGDDRIFNRLVESHIKEKKCVELERRYLTLTGLIDSLIESSVAVAMRYHGHLFCLSLGIPFLSIDYTGQKGKVSNLLKRIGYEKWREDWNSLCEKRAAKKILELVEAKEDLKLTFEKSVSKMASELDTVYGKL